MEIGAALMEHLELIEVMFAEYVSSLKFYGLQFAYLLLPGSEDAAFDPRTI